MDLKSAEKSLTFFFHAKSTLLIIETISIIQRRIEMNNYYIIMRKDGTACRETVKPIRIFAAPEHAMSYVCQMMDPLNIRAAWEFVGEDFDREAEERYKNDQKYYNTCGRIFTYENTHNGEIGEVEYYIEMLQQ